MFDEGRQPSPSFQNLNTPFAKDSLSSLINGKSGSVKAGPKRRTESASIQAFEVAAMIGQNVLGVKSYFFDNRFVFGNNYFAFGAEIELGMVGDLAGEGDGSEKNIFEAGGDQKFGDG